MSVTWIGSRTRPRQLVNSCGFPIAAGQAAQFSSTNYLERATSSGISPTVNGVGVTWMLAGWVYLTALNLKILISKGPFSAATADWFFYYSNLFGYSFGARLTTGGDQTAHTDAGTLPTVNTWHHVAVVLGGNVLTVYMDGAPGPANTGASGDWTNKNTQALRFGCDTDGANGIPSGSRLDAWGMWCGSGLPTVASLYNSGTGKKYADLSAGDKTGLICFYDLDELSGSTSWCDAHTQTYNLTGTGSVQSGAGKV